MKCRPGILVAVVAVVALEAGIGVVAEDLEVTEEGSEGEVVLVVLVVLVVGDVEQSVFLVIRGSFERGIGFEHLKKIYRALSGIVDLAHRM